jgi:SAM-dependent methyltransferase
MDHHRTPSPSGDGAEARARGPSIPSSLYDTLYAALPKSPTYWAIACEVYGDDYPADAEPFSAVTTHTLRRMAKVLAVDPRQTILDLACGRGGPGLWVARATGAALVGVDYSAVGIAHARERAMAWGLADRARFVQADGAATGLESASLDGAMCVDAFWAFPDKEAAACEVARVLRLGARFALTTWNLPGLPVQPPEGYAQVLAQAGFVIEVDEELPDWERRQLAF